MTRRKTLALIAPAILLALAPTSQAALLSTLIGGGTLVEGGTTFSNFQLQGGSSPGANLINVTTATTPGGAAVITFSLTSGTWTIPADSSRILFTATFTTPVDAVGLDFVAAGALGGIASVGETATYTFNNAPVDVPLQVITDGAGPVPDTLSVVQPLGHAITSLSILKSIDIASAGGIASITSVSNTYFPAPNGGGNVPEPASLALVALGAPMLLRRRRA
jgi:hypothetical protein